MDILRLRFDGPLMSFGGVLVDQHGVTERFPGTSLLAGMFANAFGYRHRDADKIAALQDRIEYAARWDIDPEEELVDYQTVDLGQPKMREPGWTTRGKPEHRAGGSAAFGTHQRYRHYWANGVLSAAVALTGEGRPGLADLAQALSEPARPLFLGRKSCLPAAPILLDTIQAPDVLTAVRTLPRATRFGRAGTGPMEACWPARLGPGASSKEVPVYDRRDWRNQVHAGRRIRIEGLIEEVSP